MGADNERSFQKWEDDLSGCGDLLDSLIGDDECDGNQGNTEDWAIG